MVEINGPRVISTWSPSRYMVTVEPVDDWAAICGIWTVLNLIHKHTYTALISGDVCYICQYTTLWQKPFHKFIKLTPLYRCIYNARPLMYCTNKQIEHFVPHRHCYTTRHKLCCSYIQLHQQEVTEYGCPRDITSSVGNVSLLGFFQTPRPTFHSSRPRHYKSSECLETKTTSLSQGGQNYITVARLADAGARWVALSKRVDINPPVHDTTDHFKDKSF